MFLRVYTCLGELSPVDWNLKRHEENRLKSEKTSNRRRLFDKRFRLIEKHIRKRNYVYRILHPNDGYCCYSSLQVYTSSACLTLCLSVSKTLNTRTRTTVVGVYPSYLPSISYNTIILFTLLFALHYKKTRTNVFIL